MKKTKENGKKNREIWKGKNNMKWKKKFAT